MTTILSDEMINEIAQQIECGMVCFYHKTTGELEYYPDELKTGGAIEYEFWKDIIKKVKKNHKAYLRFEGMESYESFALMEKFTEQVTNAQIQNILISALQKRKPFQEFKNALLSYPDWREKWFAYKNAALFNYVKDQVKLYNQKIT